MKDTDKSEFPVASCVESSARILRTLEDTEGVVVGWAVAAPDVGVGSVCGTWLLAGKDQVLEPDPSLVGLREGLRGGSMALFSEAGQSKTMSFGCVVMSLVLGYSSAMSSGPSFTETARGTGEARVAMGPVLGVLQGVPISSSVSLGARLPARCGSAPLQEVEEDEAKSPELGRSRGGKDSPEGESVLAAPLKQASVSAGARSWVCALSLELVELMGATEGLFWEMKGGTVGHRMGDSLSL